MSSCLPPATEHLVQRRTRRSGVEGRRKVPATFLLISSRGRRNARNDLNLEVEAGQPVDPEGRPVRIGLGVEIAVFDLHEGLELLFGICVEASDIDDVVQGRTSRGENSLKVLKGALDLLGIIGLGGSIETAANLARDKKQIARANGGGIRLVCGILDGQ